MIYLESFQLPSDNDAGKYLRETIFTDTLNTRYPFKVFMYRRFPILTFEPITIFYGTNGSGKSTLLNVISEKTGIRHGSSFNTSVLFDDYLDLCDYTLSATCHDRLPSKSRIITSDDVFNKLIQTRHVNEEIDGMNTELMDEKDEIKRKVLGGYVYTMKSLDDYDELVKYYDFSRNKFLNRLTPNIIEQSNGENAVKLFESMIEDNGLYLLDEPENSLSAERQEELKDYIVNASRFFNCQFIISTHSPFFLSIPFAKIYNIDSVPPKESKWTELPNIRMYYKLFMSHRNEFADDNIPEYTSYKEANRESSREIQKSYRSQLIELFVEMDFTFDEQRMVAQKMGTVYSAEDKEALAKKIYEAMENEGFFETGKGLAEILDKI